MTILHRGIIIKHGSIAILIVVITYIVAAIIGMGIHITSIHHTDTSATIIIIGSSSVGVDQGGHHHHTDTSAAIIINVIIVGLDRGGHV